MTTSTTQGEHAPPIQRFEIVDCIDSKHVPAVIPRASGPWVRYEDHAAQVAALTAAQPVAQQGAAYPGLPDPSPDQLRAIARVARNSSGSASDDCGSNAYVLHGWRAAVTALRTQQPAPVAAAHKACKPDMLVNGGALKLALNVLRRAGKHEVADELEATAQPSPTPQADSGATKGLWRAAQETVQVDLALYHRVADKHKAAAHAPADSGAAATATCPTCKAPCTTAVNMRGGEHGWGTTDAERTVYHYAPTKAADSVLEDAARLTTIHLPEGAALQLEPYGDAEIWALYRGFRRIRWLNEFERQFVNSAIDAARTNKEQKYDR